MSNLIFVYGTLRKKSLNSTYRLLARNANFLGEAYFQGKLYKVDYYPGVVRSENPDDRVRGEVYEITSQSDFVIQKLDEYEECSPEFPDPKEYVRQLWDIDYIDGEKIKAWIYIYNLPIQNLERIKSGDFLDFD